MTTFRRWWQRRGAMEPVPERRRKAPERRWFDPVYYACTYLDVAATPMDGFDHFMTYGWREGRNPSKDFVTLYYRDRHLDGRRLNPLTHYAATGAHRRLPTAPSSLEDYLLVQMPLVRPFFAETFYRSRVGVESDLLAHYLRAGWRERIPANATFDADAYVASNAFVESLDVSPLYHFASQQRFASHQEDVAIEAARGDNRTHLPPEPTVRALVATRFDADFYNLENGDVRAAGLDPLDHFLAFGWREGRAPDRSFDAAYYLARNPEVARAGVNPFYHYLAVGEAAGLRPNPMGTAPYPPMLAPALADWEHVAPASDVDAAECAVVMPVFKGRNETLASIHAVLASTPRTPFVLLVVNDGSPEPALVADLETLAERRLFLYESNATNVGFVRTINAGMARFADKDVVLLDSDAMVFGDWLDRLLAHARRDPRVATVTPFSNNATIMSYPLCNVNNAIEMERDAAGLDRLASRCNAGRSSDVPTGVTFCLLLTAAARAEIGLFEAEVFGHGYGDETDFCRRAARAGWRNKLAEDVFVYHVGEVSSGIPHETRRERGQKELVARHPDYPDLVKRHLSADPTEIGRIRLDLVRLAADAAPASEVHVLHTLRGGIVTHVEHEIARSLAAGRRAVRLCLGAVGAWSVDIASDSPTAPYCPNVRTLSIAQHYALLLDFLRWLAPATIRIHSLVGLGWGATLRLFDLVEESRIPYHVVLHDYTAFCHRHHLVQPNGRYCGLADADGCRACIAADRDYPEAVDPSLRRAAYARFLEGAARVLAPSHDAKARFERNGAGYAIEVRPHEEDEIAAPAYVLPERPEILRVVALGAIGVHKGSRVILNLARDAKARDLPILFHIVGSSDVTGEMEVAGVVETGRYERPEEAFALIAAVRPSCIFLPSIWPETYCYTLSMAFALRCLPVVFDIGAPAERIRDAGFGLVLPYDLAFDVKALNDRLLALLDTS